MLSCRRSLVSLVIAFLCLGGEATSCQPEPPPGLQAWDYAPAMRQVAARFQGRSGVVVHVGDSLTYANPYGQWPRSGAGKTAEDEAILRWMHTGADDDSDGWWLARFDIPAPDEGRSHTACSGLRVDELLAGGKKNLPPLRALLDSYRPQIVVFLIGSNDVSANRPTASYRADIERAIRLILDRGAICLLTTIPPHPGGLGLASSYNNALRELARSYRLPLIDLEREILSRRPRDWNGTLLERDDPHLSSTSDGVTAASAPTPENLASVGYLLRSWLTVRKLAEVRRTVLDP